MVQGGGADQNAGPAGAVVTRRLGATLDVEAVRLPLEREVYAQLEQVSGLRSIREAIGADAAATRRHLLSSSVRLTAGMAPSLHEAAMDSMQVLGIGKPLEIYQRDGAENAAMHLVPEPVLMEVRGRLITLLDPGSTRALVGHELGHYLAHGPSSSLGPAALLANALAGTSGVPEPLRLLGSKLSMAQELTADRFGLLACQNLGAALRLEMICTTGLPGSALTWDTDAYLEQCKELIEGYLRDGTSAQGLTHPEHSLRAYAAWLFSETDLYQSLTGQGPGSRRLDEVNALLRRCLGADEIRTGDDRLQTPPPEMHACALAACVLVAAADGEVADQELEVIEQVFSPLVPNTGRYFDVSEAQRQFAQLAPIVAAMGPGIHRALFSLLVHIVAADGVIDERELVAVLRIGEALGARALFECLLCAVLRRLMPASGGVAPSGSIRLDVEIPLPPRPGEGAEALALYVRSVAARGGGETSLRRLCHLLGLTSCSPQALVTIRQALASHRITPEVDLAALDDLDTVILLRVDAPTVAPPSRRVAGPAHPRLVRALTRLRDRLVSGDGRSPSIRTYEARPGRSFDLKSLDRVSVGLGERVLVSVRGGARAQLVKAQEAGKHDGAARVAHELVALLREHRSRLDETGSNDLALGYPFLTGNSSGYLVRGPLVLFPVELELQDAGARSFALRSLPDSTPVVNLPLLRILFSKRGLALPESLVIELDELAQDAQKAVENVLTRLDELGLGATRQPGSLKELVDPRGRAGDWSKDQLEIEECAVIGLFPLSNSDLLQDYDELIDKLDKGAAPEPLLGSAAALLPAELREQVGCAPIEARTDTSRLVPLIAADPTQRGVLRKARATRALVVDGPPGTGKSQVIVNLVADALGRGERVAVVSEKRAALDVVAQRLERTGLLHATALIHDVQEDRKPLYNRIATRLEAPAGELPADTTASADHLVRQAEAPLARRASLLGHRAGPTGPTVGTLLALRTGLGVDPLTEVPPSLASLPSASLRSFTQAMAELAPYASLFRHGSPWNHPQRASLVGWRSEHLSALINGLRQLGATSGQLLQARREAGGAEVTALRAARERIEAAQGMRGLRASIEEQAIFARLLGRLEAGESMEVLLDAERHALSHQDALVRVTRRPGAVLDDAVTTHMTQLLLWLGRWWRWFSPSFWRAKAAAREAAIQLFPDRPRGTVDAGLAREVLVTAQVARVLQGLDGALGRLGLVHLSPRVPADALPLSSKLATIARAVTSLASSRALLQPLGLWPEDASVEALVRWEARLDGARRAVDALAAHEAALAPCRQVMPWLDLNSSEGEVASLAAALALDGERLVQADERLAAARVIFADAAALLARASTALPASPAEVWRRTLLVSWADVLLRREHAAQPDLATLGTSPSLRELPALETALAEAAENARNAERQRVLARLDGVELLRAPLPDKGKRRTETQSTRELMLKETRKQRNVMPLRTFVRQFSGKGLLDVVPVWLLSPETMTVLFPREPLFDLVIFDEASQCTVESGLPALLRAKRFVVAGDEKQMPPSAFFKASSEGAGDEEPDDVQVEVDNDLDAESLLALARQRVPVSSLAWHYRCHSEELIAFSNHAMYGGQLLTIPSTASRAAPSMMRWIHVPDGKNEGSENLPEARRVVDELARLLSPTGGTHVPSVGVVTMNITQRKVILDEIDARKQVDRSFAEAWDRAASAERLDERPFVKNIENVQGDERDIIVFSLGYAPVERRTKKGVDRVVPARFGPLGQRGGERRLNVAVSRARQGCVVVASFAPSLLSVARTQHPGPKLFKQFLEYALHHAEGQRTQADKVLALVREPILSTRGAPPESPLPEQVPLRVQVALALGERGISCELDVGDSSFRVPLAVVSPTDPSRYLLALLCDEGNEPLEPDERHVHQPGVLRSRGWQTLSISAADWAHDRTAVLQAIEQIVRPVAVGQVTTHSAGVA